jgi:hypothetical protein
MHPPHVGLQLRARPLPHHPGRCQLLRHHGPQSLAPCDTPQQSNASDLKMQMYVTSTWLSDGGSAVLHRWPARQCWWRHERASKLMTDACLPGLSVCSERAHRCRHVAWVGEVARTDHRRCQGVRRAQSDAPPVIHSVW